MTNITETDEDTVFLAAEGTPLAVFQKVRTDAISEMFDNADESGIYPTSKFFARLDNCVAQLLTTLEVTHQQELEEAYQRGYTQGRIQDDPSVV
jgi:hypothetical protein